MSNPTLVQAEGIGKKFCRSLKRAMWYTGLDLARSVCNRQPPHEVLRRDEFWALKDVSFELKRGECLGLIGANGSGKSTLLRILNGIIQPDTGSVRIRGYVGGLIQVGAGFHPKLTGRENIYISGAIRGMSKREIDREFDTIVEFAGIGEFIDMPVMHYSSGMYVRLGYAVAAHITPDILLMDEVLAVGDAGFWHKCVNSLEKKISEGCTPIFVTHHMGNVSTICTRVIVLSHGRKIYDGDVDGGIAAYQKELWKRRSGEQPGLEWLDQRVELQEAKLLSHSPEDAVSTGDKVEVGLGLNVREPVGPLRVVVALESASYGVVSSMDTRRSKLEVPGTVGRHELCLSIRRLPLLPGHYTFKIVVLERDTGHLFLRRLGAVALHVAGRRELGLDAGHLIAMDASWDVRDP